MLVKGAPGVSFVSNMIAKRNLIKEAQSCGNIFHVMFLSCIFVSLQSLQWSSQSSWQDNRFKKTDMHVDFTHETNQYSLVHFKDDADFMSIAMQMKWHLDMIYIPYIDRYGTKTRKLQLTRRKKILKTVTILKTCFRIFWVMRLYK